MPLAPPESPRRRSVLKRSAPRGEKNFFFLKVVCRWNTFPGQSGFPGRRRAGRTCETPGRWGTEARGRREGDLKCRPNETERKRRGARGSAAYLRDQPHPPAAPGARGPRREEGRSPRAAPRRRPARRRPGGNTAAAPAGSGARCTLGPVVPSGLTRTRLQREAAACCSF